jgi:sugar phosphate isomerase/epimerase
MDNRPLRRTLNRAWRVPVIALGELSPRDCPARPLCPRSPAYYDGGMQPISRRQFVAALSASPLLFSSLRLSAAGTQHFDGDYGLQMFVIRNYMKSDFEGALRHVHALGISEMEAWEPKGVDAATLKPLLDAAGLKATSMHAVYDDFRTRLPSLEENAHGIGAGWIVCSWVNPQDRATADDYKRLAASFNDIGGKLKSSGLRLGYHNHDVEFVKFDGQYGLDILVANTDPDLVDFELDIGHVQRAGVSAESYLREHAARVKLMHLKNTKLIGTGPDGKPRYADSILGVGAIDIPAVLRIARDHGVQKYYLEEETGNVWRRVAADVHYLKTVTF